VSAWITECSRRETTPDRHCKLHWRCYRDTQTGKSWESWWALHHVHNAGSVAQFDFHQSSKSKSVLPLAILHVLEWLDGGSKSLVFHEFGFHHLNLRTVGISGCSYNLYIFQPIDVSQTPRSSSVAQDMQRVENTHCLYSRQLSPFLDFHCLFPVIDCRSNNVLHRMPWRTPFFKSVANITTDGAGVPWTYASKVKE
jgi:hypothetical protein